MYALMSKYAEIHDLVLMNFSPVLLHDLRHASEVSCLLSNTHIYHSSTGLLVIRFIVNTNFGAKTPDRFVCYCQTCLKDKIYIPRVLLYSHIICVNQCHKLWSKVPRPARGYGTIN